MVSDFSSVPYVLLVRRVVARPKGVHRRRKEEVRVVANGLHDLKQWLTLEFWPGWYFEEGELCNPYILIRKLRGSIERVLHQGVHKITNNNSILLQTGGSWLCF
jgi:hypothetical protein